MKIIETKKAPAAVGPYSQAVEINGVLYTSGQIAINPEVGKIEASDIEGQAEQCCKNIGEILSAAGMDFSKVVKTTCFLADIADFKKFNAVYEKYFISKPARSCVAVKDLPLGALCEIEVIAAV
jgi:2-iminobutanoate/2-iminopropanoate deaminase